MRLQLSILLSLFVFGVSAQTKTLSELVKEVNPSVVTIYVQEMKNTGQGDPYTKASHEGLGSGVLVSDNGWILTASHVVHNASKIVVEFYDGQKITAQTKRSSVVADVALIQLDQPVKNIQPAKVTDSDQVKIGEDVFIIGAPLGLSHSVSKGIISGKHTKKNLTNDLDQMEFFQTDASINQGNSGGPMFNMNGEVIGIVSSILSFSGGFEGLGFAASSNIARSLLLSKGSVWFGIDAFPMNYDLCKIFNVPQEGAIMVQHVADGSPAYLMGMKGGYLKMNIGETEFLAGGDIILSFDDIILDGTSKLEELRDYLSTLEDYHQYKIKVYRNGEIKELKWKMQP